MMQRSFTPAAPKLHSRSPLPSILPWPSSTNGVTITLRNSGTEPKLKYYIEASDKGSASAAAALVEQVLTALVAEFLQPDVYGLIAPKR